MVEDDMQKWTPRNQGEGMPEGKDRSADILFCFDFSRGPKSTGA